MSGAFLHTDFGKYGNPCNSKYFSRFSHECGFDKCSKPDLFSFGYFTGIAFS